MEAIILVGHGNLPKAMKNTVEMIVGKTEKIYVVSLEPEDGPEEYKKKLNEVDEGLENYESILVFSDLLGGSPNNMVFEKYMNHDNVRIISGMNLAMILTSVMSKESTSNIVFEGQNGIKSVKPELDEDVLSGLEKTQEKKTGKPGVIKNIRVDSRGIHGQVATAWIPKLGVNRIIVIDDDAIKDEIQKKALIMARPSTTKLSILSSERAVERLQNPDSYYGEEILIIILKVDTLSKMDELGFDFKEVNIGNVPKREDTEKYRNTVYLSDAEISIIETLISKGVKVTAQMVPNDKKVNFQELIN